MPSLSEQVSEFQKVVLKRNLPTVPEALRLSAALYQGDCILEELNEYNEAALRGDLVGMADALVDLVYFAIGAAVQMGIPFEQVFEVVHRKNMRKQLGVTKRGNPEDAAKPTDWVGPEEEIMAIFKGLGYAPITK